jgi:hypothetical protein
MRRLTLVAALLLPGPFASAQTPAEPTPMERSVEQLRNTVGRWAVTTEFLGEDGSVARTATGTYEFSWVVTDRVVSGVSTIPEMAQTSGILFFINEQEQVIEMVAVGADGRLWRMIGPLGGEVRTTPEFETADGGRGQLRFTRYNVSADAFESKMEYTVDGGKTWTPGNHQQFRREASPAK